MPGHEKLQAVIGTAVIDKKFREALLTGARGRVLQRFDLSGEEHDVLMSIKANSLDQFAGQLDEWISNTTGRSEPPLLPPLESKTWI